MLNDAIAAIAKRQSIIFWSFHTDTKKKSQTYFDFRIEFTTDIGSWNCVLVSEYKIAKTITKYSKWQQFNLPRTIISNFNKPKWAKGD